MPRRRSVASHACELCRHRKRKCDGNGLDPCKACHEAGVDCVYLAHTRVSKADLREEVARLRSINSDNSALLDALSSPNTSAAQLNNILQRLSDGQPRAEVAELLTQRPGSRRESSIAGSSTSFLTSASSVSFGNIPASTRDNSTSSIPSDQETHSQANLSHYKSQLPQLLDAILARECLWFCPICKETLIHDFESDSGPHSSTGLVCALLALATLLAQESITALAMTSPRGSSPEGLGYAFAQEAIASLYNGEGLPQCIADIQAIGILALYSLGNGEMKDGLGFADDYGVAIADQWEGKQSALNLADRQTYANIYCAAVSLNRLLFLIQDYEKTLDELAIRIGLERPALHDGMGTICKANLSGSIIDDAFFKRDLNLLPNDPKVLAAKLFEITEWMYKARHNPDKSMEQAIEAYKNGLQWYESLFDYISRCRDNTPLILFTHAHYQFGVMCLLTPFVLESAAIASDGTLPMVACRQAAGNIEQLVQHYGKLYNKEPLFDFMPYFKTAVVSFLEICDAKMTS